MNNPEIFPIGEPLSNDWFTGNAFLYLLVSKDKNNEFSAGSVTFEPGARTNWHTHPKGQVLIVIEGNGFYQEQGNSAKPIKKGDVVNIPENVIHKASLNKFFFLIFLNFEQFAYIILNHFCQFLRFW